MIESNVVVLDNPHSLIIVNEALDIASLDKSEIICETLMTAISPGTELAAYNGLPPLRPATTYPRLVGYCNVSKVIARGAEVTDFDIGDRVLTFQSHRSHFRTCQSKVICKVPDDLSDEHAVCGYLFHIGYDSIIRSPVCYGDSLIVVGLGVLGLTSVAAGVRAGLKVHAVSNQPHLGEIALDYGASHFHSREDLRNFTRLEGFDGFDGVISTTNSWEDWSLCLQLARSRGHIGVIGFPGRGEETIKGNPLDSQYFYDKQLTIQCFGVTCGITKSLI
jgi:threonine dehydrogenase-like Zn-dependent dehydrogenase